MMGADWEIVCWKHHESLSLGGLRERLEMVKYYMKHPRAKIPEWMPNYETALIIDILRFKRRHVGCRGIDLISDLMDLEDDDFIPVDWNKSLPTDEDFVKFCESKAVPIFRSTHIKYFVDNFTARELGAKDRLVKITFREHVKGGKVEYPGLDDKMHEMDMSYDIYDGEDGLEYHVHYQGQGVSVQKNGRPIG